MVDLSQVKMPVVEYASGRKVPIEEFRVDGNGGGAVINGHAYRQSGDPVYEVSPRITAIHPAEPAADVWVKFASGHCKDFGNVTACVGEYAGGIACCHFFPPDIPRDSIAWAMGPDAPRNAPLLMEWLDAAYARHCEPKPVLVWDDRFEFLSSATHDESFYQVNRRRSGTWFAGVFNSDGYQNIGANTFEKLEAAKQACERHAKGE